MPLTEDAIQRAAPDAGSLQNGRDLVRKRAFSDLGISADGTWLLGRCKGSGKEPYSVSVDLANESVPVGRCNCPQPQVSLQARTRALWWRTSPTPGSSARPSRPRSWWPNARSRWPAPRRRPGREARRSARKVNKAALAKSQRDARPGPAGAAADRPRRRRAAVRGVTARPPRPPGEADRRLLSPRGHVRSAAAGPARPRGRSRPRRRRLPPPTGLATCGRRCRKGRNYLDDKLSADENQAEADAVMKEVLGYVWQARRPEGEGLRPAEPQPAGTGSRRRDDPPARSESRRSTCSTWAAARSTPRSPTARSRECRRSPSNRTG